MFQETQDKEKIVNLVSDIIMYVSVWVVLLFGIHLIWFDTTLLLAALAFGIWVSFQDIIANVFAWLMILANNTYKLWDIVEVDHEKYAYFGRIEELTMKYAVLRTVDMRRVIIPNLILILFPVRTYESEDSIRYDIRCTVQYTSDIETLKACMHETIAQTSIVNQPSATKIMLEAMWDHGLEFLIHAFIDPKCGMTKKRIIWLITHRLYTDLLAKNFVIAYNHRILTLDDHDKDVLSACSLMSWVVSW